MVLMREMRSVVLMGFVQVVLMVENTVLVRVSLKVATRVAEKDLRKEYLMVLKTVSKTVSQMVAWTVMHSARTSEMMMEHLSVPLMVVRTADRMGTVSGFRLVAGMAVQ